MNDFEALDAEAELDAFEVAEVMALRQIVVPRWIRDGLDAGRLRRSSGRARLVNRRLAHRTGAPLYSVMRCISTGVVVRLPFA